MNRDIADVIHAAVDATLEDHRRRLEALEEEGAKADLILNSVGESLNNMALAALQEAGLIDLSMDENGKIGVAILSEQERNRRGAPMPRIVPGKTSTLHGDGGPLQWALAPPAPFNDVEIVCAPEGASPIGMRCYAEKKVIGGERIRYDLEPKERT